MFDRMIFAIVGRNIGEKVVSAVKKAGARGGTIVPARTSSSNGLLQILGLGEIDQDIVIILVENKELDNILGAISAAADSGRKVTGCAVVMNVSSVMKCMITDNGNRVENIKTGDDAMNAQSTHEMISVIVNSGFADDVMIAARKAGASGGTILNARGTGTQEDVKFFGITIVPEKEILLIITEKGKTQGILDAIKGLSCFSTPGVGICFCTDVDKFTVLGNAK
ncbi:MAG: P-II family nitrogen regulator [Spirochaetia bacterium]|nr:P-II family nitrogen regulator [Spirochaetia bacterium]